MRLIVILLVVSFAGCTTLAEPKVHDCLLVLTKDSTDYMFHCILPDGNEKDLSLDEAYKMGFGGKPLVDSDEEEKHHINLHIELDSCELNGI